MVNVMSSTEQDKLFNAYIDGQLSTAETARFDESLSLAEKERLAAEIKIEAQISDLLCGDIPCPDALWRRTQLLLNNQATARSRLFGRLSRMAIGAVAALLLFTVGSFVVNYSSPGNDLFVVNAATVDEFSAMATVKGTHQELCAYLASRGYGIALAEEKTIRSQSSHDIRLLGICPGDCKGEEVQQIYLDCCTFPTKIIIAPEGSEAAKILVQKHKEGKVRDIRLVGGYVAVLIGSHPAPDALDFLILRQDGPHNHK